MRFLSFFLSSFSKMIAITVDSQTCSLLIASKEKKRKKKEGRRPCLPGWCQACLVCPFFFFFPPFRPRRTCSLFFSFSHRGIWLAACVSAMKVHVLAPEFSLFFFFFIFFLFLSALILPCRQAMIWQGNKIFSGNLIHAAVVTIPLDLLAQVQKWKRSWLKKNNRQN